MRSTFVNQSLFESSKLPSIRSTLKILLPFYQFKEQILQCLIKVWERFPQEFDETLFKKAELLFILTSDEFKEQRLQKHLVRIIFSLFLIQKNLRKFVTLFGEKRHLQFRLMQTTLKFPFGSKSVLGILTGICLFDKQETFEEKHLLLAVQKFLPHLQIVKGSVFVHHDQGDSIRLVYVEFEKKGGGAFSCEEITLLKKRLYAELQARVEKNIPALFMIRNEEEVMKNILILSRELDFCHEIPEMTINFEQQRSDALSFTVILVRMVKENNKSIRELLQKLTDGIRFFLDRNQTIGYKEASVFRLEIPIDDSFLRSDFSINFYLARQKVKSAILQAIGPVRDFNGGMILKQGERLSQLKEAFREIANQEPLLIENFFYSLSPIEKQATFPLHQLSIFFQMFLDTVQKKTFNEDFPFDLKIHEEDKNSYVIIRSEDASLFKILEKTTGSLHLEEGLISFKLNHKNLFMMGFIQNKEKHTLNFMHKIEDGIETWKKEILNKQVVRLAIRLIPTSFDPRIAGDENTRILLKMLFEGLMRIGRDGKPACALARSVTILADKKTYIFHLRPSFWSDGTSLVAYDFEYAWKKLLSPLFETQFASFFYCIKNARLVKEGIISLDEVGIKAIDADTLQVVLEYPVPYFLELLTLPLFSPISHKIEWVHPNWAFQEGSAYVCNGPFCLKRKNLNYGYEFVKNPHYWDAEVVAIDQIFIRKVKDFSAYEMFEKNTIDWIGRLLPYWDPIYGKKHSNKMTSLPSPKVSWCIFNTQHFLFQNQKIRKALSYCIDKEKLISLLSYEDAVPASSPLPLRYSMQSPHDKRHFNPILAKELFQEGLNEIGLQKNQFPLFTLLFPSFILHEKTARLLQQQWEDILGISCKFDFNEWPDLFPKICKGEYEVCLITWTSWVNDPIYTLNAFKYRNEGINFSKWENPDYQHLLDLANHEEDVKQRLFFLNEAEKILIGEMPVNPLFFERSQCISQDYFHVPCDPIYGYPDFKWAFVNKTKKKDKL